MAKDNTEKSHEETEKTSSANAILVSDEIASGLATTRVGKRIICFPATDSTNLDAFKLAEEGAEEGTVVIADGQRCGKGRLGREWASPTGVNLYCSVVFRPSIMPATAYQLTFLSAVAVARAVERSVHLSPQIKWPNDILINGKKIAGLLNEMSAETEKVNFVVLGIGVNLNMRREQFPNGLRHPASSLFLETGREVDRVSFTQILLAELDLLYALYLQEGDGPIRKEWLDRCDMIGRVVKASSGDSVLTGTVTGIDDTGALLVRLASGAEEKVHSGDVILL